MSVSLPPLVDEYGRKIRKLRVSLVDACQFRCFYCMPQNPKFMRSQDWLSAPEIFEICRRLVKSGLEEIRLTGGEPTLRPDLKDIVKLLGQLPLKKLGITTNGDKLDQELLQHLKDHRCWHLNISLDSLNRDRFNEITRTKKFDQVMENIHLANSMGFHLKLNAVLMKGLNEHELKDFVSFSEQTGIEVRFLELMKIGQVSQANRERYLSAKEAIKKIQQETPLTIVPVAKDSTSFNFATAQGGHIGFIASESQPFCGNCSRWRLTARGQLRACLFSEAGVELKGKPLEKYPDLLSDMLKLKPSGRLSQIEQDMYQIGG